MPRSTSAPPLDLQVTAALASARTMLPFLRRHLRAAHGLLRPALREFSVVLVGDAEMSRLHEQFMQIAGPTDVLTFPMDEDARGRVTAGEVFVCVPEARRRSKDHGSTLNHEVLLYALHGMLHLCGYDDTTPAAYRRMHRAEDRLLTQLGVGAVFSRGADSTPAKVGRRKR
jgi:probable rRNA maturation factor